MAVASLRWLGRNKPDGFTMALLATVAVASVLPCQREVAVVAGWATPAAIALLFFPHGAKLSREAIPQGRARGGCTSRCPARPS